MSPNENDNLHRLSIWEIIRRVLRRNSISHYDGWRMDRGNPELTSLIDEPIRHTFTQRWRINVGAPIRFSPIIGYGKVFIGTDDNLVYALNPLNGEIFWKYRAGGKVSTSAAVQHLRGVSYPILWFTAEDGNIYALNAENGEFLWKLEEAETTFNSPINYRVPRNIFYNYCDGYSTKTRAVNSVTGELLWEKNGTYRCTATPLVIHHLYLLIQGIFQGGRCVKAYKTTDGEEQWSLSSSSSQAGPLTSGVYSSGWNRLYINLKSASVEAYNISSQNRLWITNLPTNGVITGYALRQRGSPTDGTLIVTQDYHIYALEGRTGKIYWKIKHLGNSNDPTTRRTPMPAIYGDLVFHVENGNQLVARKLSDGKDVWNFVLDDNSFSSPALSNRSIFIATKSGTVYSFSECI